MGNSVVKVIHLSRYPELAFLSLRYTYMILAIANKYLTHTSWFDQAFRIEHSTRWINAHGNYFRGMTELSATWRTHARLGGFCIGLMSYHWADDRATTTQTMFRVYPRHLRIRVCCLHSQEVTSWFKQTYTSTALAMYGLPPLEATRNLIPSTTALMIRW